MAKGRTAKQGRRTKSGRLARNNYPTPRVDRGTERVAKARQRFGEHYGSAIGRAYVTGLLGDPEGAKSRYQAGKKFARICTRMFGRRYRCALDDTPRGMNSLSYVERDLADMEWLFDAMRELDKVGLRAWLDELISEQYTDAGPVWLERILLGGRDPYDHAMLAHAIRALDVIAPQTRRIGIVVAVNSDCTEINGD